MQSIKTDDDALDESTTKDEKECLIEGEASKMFHPDDAVKVLNGKNVQHMDGVDPYPCLA